MEVLVRNAEKVQQLYDAFKRGEIPFILKQLDKDAVMEVMGGKEIPYAGIYHGPDDIKQYFEKLNETIETRELEPDHFFESGNMVIVTGHAKGLIRKNKKPVSTLWCHLFEFTENGKISHYRDCFDTLAIARAIGS